VKKCEKEWNWLGASLVLQGFRVALMVNRQLIELLLRLDRRRSVRRVDGQHTVGIQTRLHTLQLHTLRQGDHATEFTDGMMILALILVLGADNETSVGGLQVDIFRFEALDVKVELRDLLSVLVHDARHDGAAIHQRGQRTLGEGGVVVQLSAVLALHAVQLAHHVSHLSVIISEDVAEAEGIRAAVVQSERSETHVVGLYKRVGTRRNESTQTEETENTCKN